MLFAFGDSRSPNLETASLIEEICQQQMSEIVIRASEVAAARSATFVGVEDILFLMRRNPIKIQRLVKVRENERERVSEREKESEREREKEKNKEKEKE
jgi:hypothetical protein